MKKLGLVLGAVLAALSISASASAGIDDDDYPPAGGILILDPSTVSAGGTVTATFTGCSVGETVNFTFNPTVSATCVATATGTAATTTFTAPATAGEYPVVAVGLTSGAGATGILTVVVAGAPAPGAPAAPGGGLPATGSDSAPTMQIAGGLVAVGAGLALVGGLRRRKLASI